MTLKYTKKLIVQTVSYIYINQNSDWGIQGTAYFLPERIEG